MTLVSLFDRLSPGAGRVLATLHAFGMTLFRHADEEALLRSLCDVLVSAGYRRALIGKSTDAERTRIRPVIQSGADDLPTEIDLSWGHISPVERLQGSPFCPTTPIVARDILRDPQYERWRDDATTHGYAAAIAFTVAVGEEPWSILVINAAEPDAFDEGERALLEMLVGHLSFSLESLRRQVALVESEKKVSAAGRKHRRHRLQCGHEGLSHLYQPRRRAARRLGPGRGGRPPFHGSGPVRRRDHGSEPL